MALLLHGFVTGRDEQVTCLMVAESRRLAFAAFGSRPLDAFHGVWETVFRPQRYSNNDDNAASRCRIVLLSVSGHAAILLRQAMTWARVTLRNSLGRTIPVNHIKSLIAFS
jgi:hypothetical protein